MFDDKMNVTYVRFFQSLLKPRGELLKENQNVLLKLLLARPETSPFLRAEVESVVGYDADDDGSDKDDKEKKPAKGASVAWGGSEKSDALRAALPVLLALCAEGRNYFTERTLQKLVPLSSAVSLAAKHRKRAYAVLGAYCSFIDEVYLNTEGTGASSRMLLQYNKQIWALLSALHRAIRMLLMPQSQTQMPSSARDRFASFIYTRALPFIQHFYARAFVFVQATQQQLLLSSAIIDAICLLRDYAADRTTIWKSRRHAATSALRALHSAGVRGEELDGRISKIVMSAVSTSATDDQSLVDSAARDCVHELTIYLRRITARANCAVVRDLFGEESLVESTDDTPGDVVVDGEPPVAARVGARRDYPVMLVHEIASSRGTEFSESTHRRLFVRCLRLIRQYLECDVVALSKQNNPPSSLPPLSQRQAKLLALEGPLIFVDIIGSRGVLHHGGDDNETDAENEDAVDTQVSQVASGAEGEQAVGLVSALPDESIPSLVREAFSALVALMQRDHTSHEPNSAVCAVLLRSFASHGTHHFFADIVAFLEKAKYRVRMHKRMIAATARALHLSPDADASALVVAVSAKDLSWPVDPPLDEVAHGLLRALELLARDRTSALFRSLLASTSNRPEVIKELVQYAKALESVLSLALTPAPLVLATQLFVTLAAAVRDSAANVRAALAAQVRIYRLIEQQISSLIGSFTR